MLYDKKKVLAPSKPWRPFLDLVASYYGYKESFLLSFWKKPGMV